MKIESTRPTGKPIERTTEPKGATTETPRRGRPTENEPTPQTRLDALFWRPGGGPISDDYIGM